LAGRQKSRDFCPPATARPADKSRWPGTAGRAFVGGVGVTWLDPWAAGCRTVFSSRGTLCKGVRRRFKVHQYTITVRGQKQVRKWWCVSLKLSRRGPPRRPAPSRHTGPLGRPRGDETGPLPREGARRGRSVRRPFAWHGLGGLPTWPWSSGAPHAHADEGMPPNSHAHADEGMAPYAVNLLQRRVVRRFPRWRR
jgi:hypothetical protein